MKKRTRSMSPMSFTAPALEDNDSGEQGGLKILKIYRAILQYATATPTQLTFEQKIKLFQLFHMGIHWCIALPIARRLRRSGSNSK